LGNTIIQLFWDIEPMALRVGWVLALTVDVSTVPERLDWAKQVLRFTIMLQEAKFKIKVNKYLVNKYIYNIQAILIY
jgi:hypothetical protein